MLRRSGEEEAKSPPSPRHNRKRPVAPFSAHLDLPSPKKRVRTLSEDEEVSFLLPGGKQRSQQGRRMRMREETENINSAASRKSRQREAYKLRGRP